MDLVYNNYIEMFRQYIMNNYDITNDKIRLKYFHTLRVVDLMYDLSKELHLNDEETRLAFLIGLFHDLGRFEEIKVRGIFDNLAFDHAACSNQILYNDHFIDNFQFTDAEHLIIKKAVYYHNKKDLPDNLTDEERLFCNMIRDMDKIDILRIRSKGKRLNFGLHYPNPTVLDNYYNNDTIDLRDIKSSSDSVILYLSFIKDLIFDESFTIAINNYVLDDLLNIIDIEPLYQIMFDDLLKQIYLRKGQIKVKRK